MDVEVFLVVRFFGVVLKRRFVCECSTSFHFQDTLGNAHLPFCLL